MLLHFLPLSTPLTQWICRNSCTLLTLYLAVWDITVSWTVCKAVASLTSTNSYSLVIRFRWSSRTTRRRFVGRESHLGDQILSILNKSDWIGIRYIRGIFEHIRQWFWTSCKIRLHKPWTRYREVGVERRWDSCFDTSLGLAASPILRIPLRGWIDVGEQWENGEMVVVVQRKHDWFVVP